MSDRAEATGAVDEGFIRWIFVFDVWRGRVCRTGAWFCLGGGCVREKRVFSCTSLLVAALHIPVADHIDQSQLP
jgi:hypothetical protein